MAYEPLTPAAFKAAKPQFSEVPDPVVQQYLDLGALFVDQSWPESAYQPAWSAITCHLMTLDGLGTGIEGKAYASGLGTFQSVKSGELTLTKYQKTSETTSYSDWLGSTTCGRFFWTLLRMSKGGPRVAMGSGMSCVSPYAKDVAYAWPTFFYGWR